MSKKVEVILTQDVAKYGKKGEVVQLPSGFAQFLISQKKAMLATESAKKSVQSTIKIKQQQKQTQKQQIKEKLSTLSGKITIYLKANEKGNLFEKITTSKLAKIFKEKTGIDLAPSNFKISEPFETIGSHSFEIQFEDLRESLLLDIKQQEN